MNLHVTMHESDGWIVVECPALPGCVSQGRTREEALANIKEAIAGWLEVADEKAMQGVTAERAEVALAI